MFKLPEQDCRTVAIEVGLQNGGLASALANQMGKIATVGLAAALIGPAYEYHWIYTCKLLE